MILELHCCSSSLAWGSCTVSCRCWAGKSCSNHPSWNLYHVKFKTIGILESNFMPKQSVHCQVGAIWCLHECPHGILIKLVCITADPFPLHRLSLFAFRLEFLPLLWSLWFAFCSISLMPCLEEFCCAVSALDPELLVSLEGWCCKDCLLGPNRQS